MVLKYWREGLLLLALALVAYFAWSYFAERARSSRNAEERARAEATAETHRERSNALQRDLSEALGREAEKGKQNEALKLLEEQILAELRASRAEREKLRSELASLRKAYAVVRKNIENTPDAEQVPEMCREFRAINLELDMCKGVNE